MRHSLYVLALLVAGVAHAGLPAAVATSGPTAAEVNAGYQHSAVDFLHEAIPAIVSSGHIEEFTRRAPHPLTPSPVYAKRIGESLKQVALLGKVLRYDEPTVTVMITERPTGELVVAGFSEMVTYEKGRVVIAGNLDKSASPWGFFSFDVLPQGRARAMLTWRQASPSNMWMPYAGVDDQPDFADAMEYTLKSELDSKAFDEIDLEITDPAQHDLRLKDGASRLGAVDAGLDSMFSNSGDRMQYYPLVQEWRQKEPQSGPAALAEAIYWYIYSWDARGEGYANSVSDAGQKLFKSRLLKAEEILVDSKPVASANPLWYSTYISVQMGLGDVANLRSAFLEGVRRYPYADTIYLDMVQALQPRWYGSYGEEDDFIKRAVELTPKEGEGLYARLYAHLSNLEGSEFELFRDSKASWPRMKKGFDDLMSRHPGSLWMLNKYAAFACRANDKATFLLLDAQLQGKDANLNNKLNEGAWPTNHSHDLCENQFGVGQ